MKKVASLKDHGRPEYLDGAQMQYSVHDDLYPNGNPLAYFANKDDAIAFCKCVAKKVYLQENKDNKIFSVLKPKRKRLDS